MFIVGTMAGLRNVIITLGVIFSAYMNTLAFASEVSIGPEFRDNECTNAFINLTYFIGGNLHTEKTETGKYGSGPPVIPARGLVVHVKSMPTADSQKTNHFGCEYPFSNEIPKEPWIALIERGSCYFDIKLENALRANASAMVVYDNEEKDTLEKMTLSCKSCKSCNGCDIPGLLTYKSKGEEIANLTDQGIKVYMYITVGKSCSRPYNGINRTSVLFVSISFIVLMIISLAWLVFYYVQRFRYLHAKDRLAQRLCNAAKKALAKIPIRNVKITDKEIIGEGETCAVCLEMYRSGDILRTLPCRHEFHKGCVDPWLLEHRTCPMCKMDILKYYGFIFTGSQESILHFEDGVINSSESRETDSPTHDNQSNPPIAQLDEISNSSQGTIFANGPMQNSSIRKASLISLKMVGEERPNPCPESSSSNDFSLCDSHSVKLDKKKGKSFESPSSLLEDQHPMCLNSLKEDIPKLGIFTANYLVVNENCSVHPVKDICSPVVHSKTPADMDVEDLTQDLSQEGVVLSSSPSISNVASTEVCINNVDTNKTGVEKEDSNITVDEMSSSNSKLQINTFESES